ncbi:MAG: hypothetical protein ACOC3V_03515 [bacterium]
MPNVTLYDFIKKSAAELNMGETGLLKSVQSKDFLSKQNKVYSDDIVKFIYNTEKGNFQNFGHQEEESGIEDCIEDIINNYDYSKYDGRLDDYKLALDSTETVEYAKRAHFVLKAEILAPDADHKKTLITQPTENSELNEDHLKVLIREVEDIILKLNIESDFNNKIVDRSVLYGECYIEICNSEEELKKSLNDESDNFLEGLDVDFGNNKESFITENVMLKYDSIQEYLYEKIEDNKNLDTEKRREFIESIDANINPEKFLKMQFTINKSIREEGYLIEKLDNSKLYRFRKDPNHNKTIFLEEDIFKSQNRDNEEMCNLEDIYLKFHEPFKVIPIKTNQFLIGFLVFPDQPSIKSFNNMKNTRNQSNPISTNPLAGNIGQMQLNNPINSIRTNLENNELPPPLKNFVDKYIGILKKNLGNITIPSNLKSLLAEMITQRTRSLNASHNLKSYFVPLENMQQFKIMDDEDDPFFGQGIFKKSKHKLKLLVLIQAAIAINRLTASQDMTTLALEVGHLKKIRNVMERVKEVFLRTRKTLDDFDSIDSITSGVATTNILTVPQKDGKRFIDFEKSNTKNDVRDYIDDYKMLRDEYVAGLYVPPSHLGLEENIDARATVSKQNILFATAVLTYQKLLGSCMNRLIEKILRKVNPDVNYKENINVSYPEPHSLLLENTNEIIDKIRNLIDTMKNLNVPEAKILDMIKKYLPGEFREKIDLEEISESIKNYVSEKNDSDSGGDSGYGGF